jgi:transketolase
MRVDPQNPADPERDRFVLSKGHAAPALYAVLADMGFCSGDEMRTFRQLGCHMQGHPDKKKLPGVDASTGSLGQGVSIATGMAIGAKARGSDLRVFTILGDGELQEGLVWEAAMAAAHYKLDNLTVIIDNNGLQIDGPNDEVMSLGNIADKYRAFGFHAIDLPDGHDLAAIEAALADRVTGKPSCIVAHTIKGKGVSFLENQVGWHGKALSPEQLVAALAELK